MRAVDARRLRAFSSHTTLAAAQPAVAQHSMRRVSCACRRAAPCLEHKCCGVACLQATLGVCGRSVPRSCGGETPPRWCAVLCMACCPGTTCATSACASCGCSLGLSTPSRVLSWCPGRCPHGSCRTGAWAGYRQRALSPSTPRHTCSACGAAGCCCSSSSQGSSSSRVLGRLKKQGSWLGKAAAAEVLRV